MKPGRTVKPGTERACPFCKARVGAPCRAPSGHALWGGKVHAERRTLELLPPNPQILARVRELAGATSTAPRRTVAMYGYHPFHRRTAAPPPEPAERRIGCRVNDDDRRRIQAAARSSGLTDASYIRGAALLVAELLRRLEADE